MRFIEILTDEERQYITDMQSKNYNYTPMKYTNTDKVIELFNSCFNYMKTNKQAKIGVFFDIDFDGLASGYIMLKMLLELSKCTPDRVVPFINKKRIHGLTEDIIEEINNNKDIVLLVIVDSSTNDTTLLNKINANIVVIDHHDVEVTEYIGKTKCGDYIIVNNNIDKVENKSAAEVVYEFWHEYAEATLVNLQLEEWVAISLYSDVINYNTKQNMWFMSYLLDIGPTRDIREIAEPLNLIQIRNGKQSITRDKISFSLVPLVNSCMRLQCGRDLIDTVLYRPHTIAQYKSCVLKQKELTTLLCRIATNTMIDKISFVKLNKTIQKKVLNPVEMLQTSKDNALLKSVDSSVLDGFNGLIATKYAEKYETTSLAYDIVEEDGIKKLKGSVRTGGPYRDIQLRTWLKNKPYWTASGHGDAFGFTYDCTHSTIEQAAQDIISILSNIEQIKHHQTRFFMSNYNFLSAMANTMNEDTISDVLTIADLHNLKTLGNRYYFVFTVGAGFRKPTSSRLSDAVSEHVYEGLGKLRLKLRSFNDELKFEVGETYEVYFEGTDDNNVLGIISKVTETSNVII